MGEYITGFRPWNKTYCFTLDKYDCYFRRHMRCSLNRFGCFDVNKSLCSENDKEFCLQIAISILKQGFFEAANDVIVYKHTCRHYSVEQGQHRVCICARLKVPMKVYYEECDNQCFICNDSKHSLKRKLSYALLRERDFLLKL